MLNSFIIENTGDKGGLMIGTKHVIKKIMHYKKKKPGLWSMWSN